MSVKSLKVNTAGNKLARGRPGCVGAPRHRTRASLYGPQKRIGTTSQLATRAARGDHGTPRLQCGKQGCCGSDCGIVHGAHRMCTLRRFALTVLNVMLSMDLGISCPGATRDGAVQVASLANTGSACTLRQRVARLGCRFTRRSVPLPDNECCVTSPSRSGVFETSTDQRVDTFTESISFDRRLYAHDIAGSIAHAQMLADVGLITPQECEQLVSGLETIRSEIEADRFAWRVELEDIHMHIEQALIDRLGDVGRKLHTGRSRNDQVSTATRLVDSRRDRSNGSAAVGVAAGVCGALPARPGR